MTTIKAGNAATRTAAWASSTIAGKVTKVGARYCWITWTSGAVEKIAWSRITSSDITLSPA